MKAVVRSKYGTPEVLTISDIDIPIPKDNEVLIKVRATTVNRTDYGILKGTPFIIRLFTGLSKPRLRVAGSDFAGQIEAVGRDVQSFKVGDKVMGFGMMGIGSHAEYLALPENAVMIIIPYNITYHQAAACLEGGLYAFAGIDAVKPQAGNNALVNGATGAIGSSIVQILKFYGVYVTAVCGGENRELVKQFGADTVIDYKTDDFTKDSGKYDFVFDTVGKSTFSKCKRLLKAKGMYIPSDGFLNIFLSLITPMFKGKKVMFSVSKNQKADLSFIKNLVEKGSFKPLIDRTYPIDKIVEAYTYVAAGQKIGNVIIAMDV